MPEAVGATGMRALVVEDHPLQRDVAVVILQRLGYSDILTASDGHDALNLIKSAMDTNSPVTLILCDLNMPNMDGLEFLRHLHETQSRARIILTSAMESDILSAAENLGRARNLNILGAVEKPLKIGAISRLLDRRVVVNGEHSLAPAFSVGAYELANAIRIGEIVPYFQPQVATNAKLMQGVEMLARWKHPHLGLVSPVIFMPLAEKTGLMSDMTRILIREGLAQCQRWLRQGHKHRVAFNLSVGLLSDMTLPDTLNAMALEQGVPPEQIVLEVTESHGIENLADALEILIRFRVKGFELSIDDFGTGHSTLEQLRQFPFTELKVDKTYVTGAFAAKNIRAMLESTVIMARKLGLRVIAEGVETRDDWNLVTQLRCDEVQGYYIAHPMPASEVAGWKDNYQSE